MLSRLAAIMHYIAHPLALLAEVLVQIGALNQVPLLLQPPQPEPLLADVQPGHSINATLEEEDSASRLPLSVLVAASEGESGRPLSTVIFDAISNLGPGVKMQGSIAFCIEGGLWFVVRCNGGRVMSAANGVANEVARACDATVAYRDAATFAALMDDAISSATAVALGRLRVRGSLSIAMASEDLYERAEQAIRLRARATREQAAAAQHAQQEREAEAAAALKARRARAEARPCIAALCLQYAGTDQQLGSWLLLVGAVLYAAYTGVVLWLQWGEGPSTRWSNGCYAASALLWLLGSIALVHASSPHRVLQIARRASSDAADASRLRRMGRCHRWLWASSLLLGAWGLGLGALAFLAGAACQLVHHPPQSAQAVVPSLYALAGICLFVATALMVLGAAPRNLAANGGQGSAHTAAALKACMPCVCVRGCISHHLATDMLAGAWFFAVLMLLVVAYALADAVLEPSALSAAFLGAQAPFGLGAVIMARASYAEALNRASMCCWTTRDVTDAMLVRGLVTEAEV